MILHQSTNNSDLISNNSDLMSPTILPNASTRNWRRHSEQQRRVTLRFLTDFPFGSTSFLEVKKFDKSTTSFSQTSLKAGTSFRNKNYAFNEHIHICLVFMNGMFS